MFILIKLQVICTNNLVGMVQNAVCHTGHTDDNDFLRINKAGSNLFSPRFLKEIFHINFYCYHYYFEI